MASKTMKAVKVLGINHAEVQDVPLPELQAHEILVKVHCVALNPLDWSVPSPNSPFRLTPTHHPPGRSASP